MILRSLFRALPALVIINYCTALPAQTPPTALNLHQNLSPLDVNELGKDQRVKALLDVQTTIDEVQKLLSADPSLPRLTKGEITDLFQKVTKSEYEQSVINGDAEKQEFMRNLILALPYQSDELAAIDNLAKIKASTMPPTTEPEVPEDLKQLLKSYGLLENEEKKIGLKALPVLPDADSPSSILIGDANGVPNAQPLTLEYLERNSQKSSRINPKDYESFKPLAGTGKNISSEMDSFFKQFGLNQRASIKPKDAKNYDSSRPSIDSSYLTPDFSKFLGSIGISTIDDEKNRNQKKKFNSNVARPANMKAEEDDYRKLTQLLDTIKELEKLNSTSENKASSSNIDPVKYSIKSGPQRNSIKRQPQSTDSPTKLSITLDAPLLESSLESTDDDAKVPPTTTTEEAITTTESSVDESSTTEEAKKNTLEDEIEPVDDSEIEQLPSPRRSGFYMIFDWNTFLEVGEDPQKIVVRFDPKIGDPTRFLPVNVP